MENQNPKKHSSKRADNNLEWGTHNPKLTAENFIGHQPKKSVSTDELLVNSNAKINLSDQKKR